MRLSQRAVPGQALPLVRAETTLDADVYRVMAVIQDAARHSEWIDACIESALLERESERVGYVYARFEAPWPLDDRDAVLRSEIEVLRPGVELLARFSLSDEVPAPARRGTQRMARLDGSYHLVERKPGRTDVVYELDIDPGGLPAWFAERVTRDMPLETLVGLRGQVRRVGERYRDWRAHWDPDWATP